MPLATRPTSYPNRSFHYLPISDHLFHSGFYVTSAGQATVEPGAPYPPDQHPSLYQFLWDEGRTLPEFSFLLITKGSGTFDSKQTGIVPLQAGMALILFPGVWHRYTPHKTTGWVEKWVHFNGEFAHRLHDEALISELTPVLTLTNAAEAERTLDDLLNCLHAGPTYNSLAISMAALRVLGTALSSIVSTTPPNTGAAPSPKAEAPIISAALDFIWTQSHHVLSVEDVAAHVGINRRTLERHMMTTLGHTVLEEIILCRFNRAERLIRETDLPIKTIVNLAGFGSAENMRQVFVARTGVSPAEYRKRKRH